MLTILSYYTVDGRYSMWSNWTECSATCGGAIQTRNRTCNNPMPMYGGRDCYGDKEERRICAQSFCLGKFSFNDSFFTQINTFSFSETISHIIEFTILFTL